VAMDETAFGEATAALKEACGEIDKRLGETKYLAGDAPAMADIVVAATMFPAFAKALDPAARDATPRLVAYMADLAANADVKSVLGKLRMCDMIRMPKAKAPKAPKEKKSAAPKDQKEKEKKKETGLGLSAKREDDFGAWYSQVVVEGDLIDYYDISGCYILKPWAYAQWEVLQRFFDQEIKDIGVENCYFPMFVSASRLEAEKDHIEDFAPEVAWVTKSGETDLECPIAVRPTSETVMYPHYAQWIRSHRDLPLRLNQWCNVVRWEFKHPTPFIRSREFLWQEGHTAFSTKEECDVEVRQILDLYRRVYEEYLAVPVVPGTKSEKEKFAGGLYTTTVEAYIPGSGRGVQGATSHCLGQNFAKMFHIEYEDQAGGRSMVWQNSWGFTTRTLGVCYMVHGDNDGLVLPPKVAPVQAIVITIPSSKVSEEQKKKMNEIAETMTKSLKDAGVRSKLDARDNYTPGWKYNHWELKGVPLRVEFGMRDMENNTCVIARRDNREKESVKIEDLPKRVKELCEQVQNDMFERAKKQRDENIVRLTSWDGFISALDEKKLIMTPWCNTKESEELVKKKSTAESAGGAAKTLCIPFEQPALEPGTKCFITGEEAKCWVLWGRSY